MKIYLPWLQRRFAAPLPAAKDLANLIVLRSFEVEGVEDDAIELGVLPNRAHDCLGYDGLATEVAAITGLALAPRPGSAPAAAFKTEISCAVEDARCRRFVAAEVRGVAPKVSPQAWGALLEAHGSRAINAIVDATNVAMLEANQPTHAFDADKVQGEVTVRASRAGERLETLDGKDLALEEGTLVIADEAGPLDLAGVKGGARAGVSDATTRVLLTSCNFDGPTIRRAAMRHGIRTDASKRFEGELAPELAARGLEAALAALAEAAASEGFSVSETVDVWPRRAQPFRTGVSTRECSALLGYEVAESEIAEKLQLVGCEVETGVDPQARLVEVATAALGRPYKYGASVRFDAPETFDCSSLVAYACAQAGLAAPRMAVDQSVWARPIAAEDAQPGDLVFSDVDVAIKDHRPVDAATREFLPGTPVVPPLDHVGILVGGGEVVHATGVGGGFVKKEALADSPQFRKGVRYGRVSPLGETRVVATVRSERLDLRRPEDLIEEVGRLLGYERVPETPTPDWGAQAEDSAEFRLGQAIRASLVAQGFSEVMTSSFAPAGELKVKKPQNEEKPFLRTNVADGFAAALARNYAYRDWLEVAEVRSFEIGKVFTVDGEQLRLCIGVAGAKRKAENVSVPGIFETVIPGGDGASFVEISLDDLLVAAPDAAAPLPASAATRFVPLSPYPYSARDVAVWVPGEGGEEAKVADIISAAAGPLLVKLYKFDEFTKRKDGEPTRTSYAFRLILQAMDRTLSDAEIAGATDAAYGALRAQGWEIR